MLVGACWLVGTAMLTLCPPPFITFVVLVSLLLVFVQPHTPLSASYVKSALHNWHVFILGSTFRLIAVHLWSPGDPFSRGEGLMMLQILVTYCFCCYP